jgi:hypothetical protein
LFIHHVENAAPVGRGARPGAASFVSFCIAAFSGPRPRLAQAPFEYLHRRIFNSFIGLSNDVLHSEAMALTQLSCQPLARGHLENDWEISLARDKLAA